MLLKELQELWRIKKYSYLKSKKICDFRKAEEDRLTHIKTKAIDFDSATKDIHDPCNKTDCFCPGKGKGVSSCDALDVVVVDSKNKINLIEFKGVFKQDKKKKDRKDPKKTSKDKREAGRKLKKKFEDSLRTISKLVKDFKPGLEHELKNVQKQPIVSIEFSGTSRKDVSIYLDSLTSKNVALRGFSGRIKLLETRNFDKCYPKYR